MSSCGLLTKNTAYNNEVIKNHSAEIFQIEHKNNYSKRDVRSIICSCFMNESETPLRFALTSLGSFVTFSSATIWFKKQT